MAGVHLGQQMLRAVAFNKENLNISSISLIAFQDFVGVAIWTLERRNFFLSSFRAPALVRCAERWQSSRRAGGGGGRALRRTATWNMQTQEKENKAGSPTGPRSEYKHLEKWLQARRHVEYVMGGGEWGGVITDCLMIKS